MTARESLAAAHAAMSPEAIANHALALAVILEGNEVALAKIYELVDSLDAALEASERARAEAQIALRQVENLHSANRQEEAGDLLRQLAAVELPPTARPLIDRSLRVPLIEAWPDVFSPETKR
jgi:hypothetical protein